MFAGKKPTSLFHLELVLKVHLLTR